MSTYTRSVEDALEAAVLARFGSGAAVDVVSYLDRDPDSRGQVLWYALAIRRGRLGGWQIVGRRRTRADLIDLARTCQL
jgi:hypothetical protein